MATLKYSRQREAIKDYLSSTTSHPTADIVYTSVKQEFPNISLGTVYRNLNLLATIGEAIKITTPDGADRFDATTAQHYHFYCRECGAVIDMDMNPMSELDQHASSHFGGTIETHTVLFSGICEKCKNK